MTVMIKAWGAVDAYISSLRQRACVSLKYTTEFATSHKNDKAHANRE